MRFFMMFAIVSLSLYSSMMFGVYQKEISELKETIDYVTNPDNIERVIVINENLKSRQDRVYHKIQDIIEFYRYPKYLTNAQLQDVSRIVVKYADRYQVPENLIVSVINTESAFDSRAVSHCGAQGFMQLMPETSNAIAKELRVDKYDMFTFDTNIRFGTYYLRKMLKEFDTAHAVRAYNAGPENVKRGIENGETYSNETILYHIKVMGLYENLVYHEKF